MKKALIAVSSVLLGIMALVIAIMFLGSFVAGGSKALVVQAITFGIILFVFFIGCIAEKKWSVSLIALSIGATYYLMLICAVNDFPEFLRSIPGDEFIGKWLLYALAVTVLFFIIMILFGCIFTLPHVRKGKDMLYSDSDLMLLQNFDKPKTNGYYLLKGQLYGILKHSHIRGSVEFKHKTVITVNSANSPEQVDEYCEKNPQVKKIVEYIKAEGGKGNYATSDSIIRNVETTPTLQSEGGIFSSAVFKSAYDIGFVFNIIYTLLLFCPAIMKLMMGMYNDKATGNLVLALVIFTVVFCFAIPFIYAMPLAFGISWYTEKLIQHKASQYKNIPELIKKNNFEKKLTEQEAKRILRAYVLYDYPTSDYLVSNDSQIDCYRTELFAAIVNEQMRIKAEAEAKKKTNSIDSGCSSCGSCGGGCGSCGGCGGCGD